MPEGWRLADPPLARMQGFYVIKTLMRILERTNKADRVNCPPL